jgi:hypothetical protein
MVYTMGKKNDTAVAFMSFVRRLIVSGWLQEGDIICLDNARIHTGGDPVDLEGLLWDYERDGRPLRILTGFCLLALQN